MKAPTVRLTCALSCLAMLGCAAPKPRAASASATSPIEAGNPAWDAYVAEFIEQYLAARPTFAVGQGRHEFDGKLPDWSREGLAAQIAWLEASQAKARELGESGLSPEQNQQREYFASVVDGELFWLREVRVPFTHPMFYIGGLDPNPYVSSPYAPIEERLKAFVRYARAVPGALEHVRANLELPMPRTFVDFAVAGFEGYAEFYRDDVPRAFATVTDPELNSELSEAIEPAARAMSELAQHFASQATFAERGYVLGAERFQAMLWQTERVTTPIAELISLGNADLERNLKALESACAAFVPGASLEHCVAKMNAHEASGGAVQAAAKQLATLKQYVNLHGIVSIPGRQEARVAKAPAFARQNFAYIDIPGPYEKNLPATYYIAPPDPRWAPAEQEAYVPGRADLLFTSIHEVWPGHFLQFLHSNRASWRFGQLFVSYAFSEGWAHYAEELMLEDGLADGAPELRVGQLVNALLRNVRLLCAIGLHAQDLSVEQCEAMFKEKAFQDPGNARQQAARGTYDPAYLNYTMGKLMIQRLRTDWKKENPTRARREFHDELLSHGGPPLPLLRELMLRDPGDTLF